MPTCRVAGHSGSVAGPVVLPVKDRPHAPGPWCCRRAALPAGCRRAARGAAGRSLGKRCRPVVLPGQDRPHAPGPVVLPTCRAAGQLFYVLRSRRFSGAIPALPFHLLDSLILDSVLLPTCQPLQSHSLSHLLCTFLLFSGFASSNLPLSSVMLRCQGNQTTQH